MEAYQKSQEEVLREMQSSRQGLTAAEAEARQTTYGPNRLKEGHQKSLLRRFLEQLADPMTMILLAAALISGITAAYAGESFADVVIILAVVLINAVLGVAQESKAEKAIAALQEIAAATSRVLRDGQLRVVRSEELVPGDVIVLEAGDAVPADARILECASLKVEEAALTGESVPVNKREELNTAEADIPLGDRKNMLYMGSSVAYGRAQAVVVQTGMQTEMGKIAEALAQAKEEDTPLQKKLAQLSKILSIAVAGICVFIFLLQVIRAYPDLQPETLLDTFLVAVSLAVAAIPEGLAAVVTIVLSIGVTNMAKRSAVIRKLTAVETLGCAQVICSDKTGTLTQNKMTVTAWQGSNEQVLALAMALCSDAELQEEGAVGEPTECALVEYAARTGVQKTEWKEKYPRIGEAPFDSMRKMMSTLHEEENGAIVQFTKGAPDEILKRCTMYLEGSEMLPMTEEIREEILRQNQAMADQALRVLAAAMRLWAEKPDNMEPSLLEEDLCYVGMTGMIDPVRPEVKAAIQRCKKAGIRPIMITGDHLDTAAAIAMELGIIRKKEEAITGAMLDGMSDAELEKKIASYSVYARVQPEHKVRIVNAWKKKGKITAMTGDGVNDAPSIKNADIGIGMGITGTDVTKNVADMVLADDNFATIVAAVEEGRRIYDNIRKSIQFLLASNLAEVLAVFISSLLGFTILKPVHLLWVNLITDCFPALALGMEQAESDVMQRKPRDPKESILAHGLGWNVLWQGTAVTVITLFSYFLGHYMESGRWEIVNSADGMTMAFLTLSMAEIFHSFNMRSMDKSLFHKMGHNRFLWIAMAASLASTVAVIYLPGLSDAFSFTHISLTEYLAALGLAFCMIPLAELGKGIVRLQAKAEKPKKKQKKQKKNGK